jgi:ATPase subunit of ABC transporter with duplicated ATPase domains
VTSVLELDGHDHTAALYNEPWAAYLEARALARQEAEHRYTSNQAERARLAERARQQRQWVAKGVRAQRTPPDNDRALRQRRIERTQQKARRARQSERALERLERVDKPWEPWELQFDIGRAERSGDLVAELVDATLARGRFRLGPVSIEVGAGERVAVCGANGHGKTTLVQALLGQLELDSGRQRTGRSVIAGWLDQARTRLSPPGSFIDRFCVETGLVPGEARALLAKFGLLAEHLRRPATEWSPGERTRAVLAAFQATGVNTIVLDEPTNHLDLPAIEQLEQALGRFEGTMLLISHDRVFLDNVLLTRSITVEQGRIVADELR